MWERREKEITGNMVTIDFKNIAPFLDTARMNPNKTKSIVKPKTVPKIVVEKPSVESKVDLKEAEHILNRLPVERYEHEFWIKVGFALHHGFDGDDKALELFDAWSEKDPKPRYNYKSVAKLWYSINPCENPVTMATLKMWANENTDTTQETNIFETLYQSKGKDAMIIEFNKWAIYNRTTDEIICFDMKERGDFTIKDSRTADQYFAKLGFNFSIEKPNGKPMKVNVFKEWANSGVGRTVKNLGYEPGNTNPDLFNTFQGFAISKEEADAKGDIDEAQPLIDHAINILANGDKSAGEYTMKWLAFNIQYPGVKPGVGLFIKSIEGAGKNLFFEQYFKVQGTKNIFDTENLESVIGQYNMISANKKIILLNEAIYHGDAKSFSALKTRITEKRIKFREIYGKPNTLNCYAGFIMLSNEDQFLKLTSKNRRGMVLEASGKMATAPVEEKTAYFDKIAAVSPYSFAKYLYNLDLTGFNVKDYPKTEAEKEQVEGSLDSITAWWKEILIEDKLLDENLSEIPTYNGPGFIVKDEKMYYKKAAVYEAYCDSLRKGQYGYAEKNNAFWRKMKRIAQFELPRISENGTKHPCVCFASLEDLRKTFNEVMGYEVDYQ